MEEQNTVNKEKCSIVKNKKGLEATEIDEKKHAERQFLIISVVDYSGQVQEKS